MFVCMKTRPETIILKGIPLVDKYVVTFKIATLLDFFSFWDIKDSFQKPHSILEFINSNFSVESGSPDALIWLEGQRLWKKSKVCTLGLLLYFKLTAIFKCLLRLIILKFPYMMPNTRIARIFKIPRALNFTEAKHGSYPKVLK